MRIMSNQSLCSPTPGKTVLKPETIPSSWGCGKVPWANMKASSSVADTGGDKGKAAMIKKLQDGNKTTLMLFRVLGVLGAWAAIFCCLYPIIAFFDIMEDYLAMIPCVGGCLSVIGQIVEWLVTIVVCCMSCSIGCSCAFFVIAVTWVVMRPKFGIPMLLVSLVMFAGAWGVMHMAPKKESGQAREMNVELNAPGEGRGSFNEA